MIVSEGISGQYFTHLRKYPSLIVSRDGSFGLGGLFLVTELRLRDIRAGAKGEVKRNLDLISLKSASCEFGLLGCKCCFRPACPVDAIDLNEFDIYEFSSFDLGFRFGFIIILPASSAVG